MALVVKGKFKQWWSTIPPISIKQTTTSHFNSFNTKKIPWHWTMEFEILAWYRHKCVAGLNCHFLDSIINNILASFSSKVWNWNNTYYFSLFQVLQDDILKHEDEVKTSIKQAEDLIDNNRTVEKKDDGAQQLQKLKFNTTDLKVRFDDVSYF